MKSDNIKTIKTLHQLNIDNTELSKENHYRRTGENRLSIYGCECRKIEGKLMCPTHNKL